MSKTARRITRQAENIDEDTKRSKQIRDRVFDAQTHDLLEDDDLDTLPFKEDIKFMMKQWK